MSDKKYAIILIGTLYSILLIIFSINLFVDPFYFTGISNRFNQYFPDSYERILKRNYLFKHQNEFNALILGSSRTVRISPTLFKNDKIVNLGVSGIHSNEYITALELYKKYQGQPDFIFLGLDFYATQENLPPLKQTLEVLNLFRFIKEGVLLNLNVNNFLSYTLNMIQGEYPEKESSYLRNPLQKIQSYEPKNISFDVEKMTLDSEVSLKNYIYDRQYLPKLMSFKDKALDSKIVIFIPPVHMSLFQLTFTNAGFINYRQFIHELVDTFGYVYEFSGPNSITTNQKNYFDPSHLKNEGLGCIVYKITERQSDQCPSDFGVKVNKENVDSFLDDLEKRSRAYIQQQEANKQTPMAF